MASAEVHVVLPHGLRDDAGSWHRRAVLRPLDGHQELALAEAPGGGAAEVSTLLAGTLAGLGDYLDVDAALVAALTRGDRAYLLLRLRAAMYGDRLALVVRCANPGCGGAADVDLAISDLAPDPATEPPGPITACGGAAIVREPTGADDLALEAVLATADHATAVATLWCRLVSLAGRAPTVAEWQALPITTRQEIALALTQQSRAPDLAFVARCPHCAAWIEIELDPWHLLVRELTGGGDRLLAEVHALAFHYHWSEDEILALPRTRRWRYLELLRRELEGRPLLDPRH